MKKVLMSFVALVAIAAAATGPARAQSHQKYTSGTVAVSALQEGDTLCQGATINKDVTGAVMFAANRWKYGNPPVVKDAGAYFNVTPYTILDGAAIAWSDGYATPVDENGNDGDAWIVTSKTGTDYVQLYLGGILLPPPPLYTVKMAPGTEDSTSWSFNPDEAPTTGVAEGTVVNISYTGSRKVKSVVATYVPAALPAATVATAPTATANVTAGSTTALVSAGTAEGGTMMYLVTTTNTQPASTEGFSATVPTAESLNAAGTYYVWYFAAGDAEHSDSEISASAVAVTVTVATITVTWNSFPTSGFGTSFSQDGITLTAEMIDWEYGGIEAQYEDGKFTSTVGNFTKIEITADHLSSWSGWTKSGNKATWTGNASNVTFRSSNYWDQTIDGLSSIVFTIQPN